MKTVTKNQTSLFEQIRRTDAEGIEYWTSRDLAKVLEYSEYRHFPPTIDKAKEACVNSKYRVFDHFEDMLEMVTLGSGAERSIDSIKLLRYACYLIVQNADPSKSVVANGQTYFEQLKLGQKCARQSKNLEALCPKTCRSPIASKASEPNHKINS